MSIAVKQVHTSADRKKFIDYPHDLFRDDVNYVPELYISQSKLFDKKENPFFKHAEADLFLAFKNGKIVGRIAAVKNGNYLQYTSNNDCFFGFFDFANDEEVSKTLLDTVKHWAKERGFKSIIGPVNFSTNDTCGMLVEGHDMPPVMQMTYNPSYYLKHVEKFGFRKKMDLLAYRLITEKLQKKSIELKPLLIERLERRGIKIRNLNLKDFKNEVNKIRGIYNGAWEANWGFVPMTREEFSFAAADMKAVVDTDFAYMAEYNGEPIGFSLSIPNLNEVTINIRRGRLFPTGLFKLLMNKNKIRSVRVITLGVLEKYRKMGIEACFYAMNIETALKKNYKWAEASWILENNEMMNLAMQKIGADAYKRYRIYELPLN